MEHFMDIFVMHSCCCWKEMRKKREKRHKIQCLNATLYRKIKLKRESDEFHENNKNEGKDELYQSESKCEGKKRGEEREEFYAFFINIFVFSVFFILNVHKNTQQNGQNVWECALMMVLNETSSAHRTQHSTWFLSHSLLLIFLTVNCRIALKKLEVMLRVEKKIENER